ncbi:MAG: YceI family protein [Mycobacteriaceae bacterium]|nr:YceI family protein [Mycobacteriaceae bacterium]
MSTVTTLLSSPQAVGVWKVVPSRSTIGFRAKSMWGLVPVKGTFSEFSGDGQITDTQTVFGRIDVKATSLDTKIGRRNTHLRSADFFEVETYPDISVVVTSAEGIDGDTVDLRANLTVKTTTGPLPLKAKVAGLDDGAVRVTAEATLARKEFGVEGNLMGMIPDKVTAFADLVFERAAG